jgi:hypothetical protein
MQTCELFLLVQATGPDMGLSISIDNQLIFKEILDQSITPISYQFDDVDEQDHELKIEMYGKLSEHTKVNSTGIIVEDRVIKILTASLNDINLIPVDSDEKTLSAQDINYAQLFSKYAKYCHNFNGSGELTEQKFFGTLGCNGTVYFKFASPVYLWLLENM